MAFLRFLLIPRSCMGVLIRVGLLYLLLYAGYAIAVQLAVWAQPALLLTGVGIIDLGHLVGADVSGPVVDQLEAVTRSIAKLAIILPS
ncbi:MULTISPECIES: hypothetical protein [unclassified Leucobacter]|uniref:hypothetical protein n=1 Tax=unclassified Leucobacter TaxID=2621730 RepID=UPI00301B4623